MLIYRVKRIHFLSELIKYNVCLITSKLRIEQKHCIKQNKYVKQNVKHETDMYCSY